MLNCKTLRCLVIILNPLLLLYYVIHDNKTIFIVIVIVIVKKINQWACYNRIWSWSPMPCEKHGPRASVTTKTSAFGLGFCLLSPSGHVFHTAWETMIKSYNISHWYRYIPTRILLSWLVYIIQLQQLIRRLSYIENRPAGSFLLTDLLWRHWSYVTTRKSPLMFRLGLVVRTLIQLCVLYINHGLLSSAWHMNMTSDTQAL